MHFNPIIDVVVVLAGCLSILLTWVMLG